MRVLQPETMQEAVREIADADAAFGTIPPEVLAAARRLRWLQAPQIAPPAGFYYPELVAHPRRGHQFPRDLQRSHRRAHHVLRARLRARLAPLPARSRCVASGAPGRWIRRRAPARSDRADPRRGRHRHRGRAPVPRLRHARDRRRRPPRATRRRAWPSSTAPSSSTSCCPRADFVIMTVPHTPATEGMMHRERLRRMKRTAFLINIGRGMTVRLDDLVAALQAGRSRAPGSTSSRSSRSRPTTRSGRAQRPAHAAHRRLRPLPRRPPPRDRARQLPPLRCRPAAAQRGGQGVLVLAAMRLCWKRLSPLDIVLSPSKDGLLAHFDPRVFSA